MEIINKNKKTFILLLFFVFALTVNAVVGLVFPRPQSESPITARPSVPPQGSPETSEEAQQSTQNYYPLAPYSPPENANFYFLYTGRLQLKVYLKNNQTSAKKEFEAFAKSKSVDLSTHQITYLTPP